MDETTKTIAKMFDMRKAAIMTIVLALMTGLTACGAKDPANHRNTG